MTTGARHFAQACHLPQYDRRWYSVEQSLRRLRARYGRFRAWRATRDDLKDRDSEIALLNTAPPWLRGSYPETTERYAPAGRWAVRPRRAERRVKRFEVAEMETQVYEGWLWSKVHTEIENTPIGV